MRLVEVFQACRGNYEDDGCFRQYSDGILTGTFTVDGLRRGHRFGLIASSDHGHGAAYVGAFATALDRGGVFEALHARRTFAATTRNLLVDARVAGTFMGGETYAQGPVEVAAYVRGFRELARVDVVRGGDVVHTVQPQEALPAGWVRAQVRLEWGGSPVPTDWSGDLEVVGGEVVRTPWWSPEVTSASSDRVSWECSTTSFGAVYGAQRGGIELTLVGPPDARVVLRTAQGGADVALGTVVDGTTDVRVPSGHLRLQPGVGGLVGLGTNEVRLSWTDPRPRPTDGTPDWYYVRAFQVDGEMVWSSPVWVSSAAPL
jgi:hypothetical protein